MTVEHTPEFFNFLIRKDFCWEDIIQEMSDRLMEDEFNSDIAEKALDIAFELYPDGSDTHEELMELRHTFVSDFMEHCRCEYVMQSAGNLGMFTREEAQNNADIQAKEAVKFWKNKLQVQADNFRNMSGYQFSQWKLDNINDQLEEFHSKEDYFDPCELDVHYDSKSRIPQDSEDECWEQMRANEQSSSGYIMFQTDYKYTIYLPKEAANRTANNRTYDC